MRNGSDGLAADKKRGPLTNSTNGKPCMTVEGFTSKDICAIIKECAKSGVSVLSLGDIYIDFGKKATLSQDQAPEKANQVESVFPAPRNVNLEEEIAQTAKIQDTSDAFEEELATLQISDPFEYEELISQEALRERREPVEEAEENR